MERELRDESLPVHWLKPGGNAAVPFHAVAQIQSWGRNHNHKHEFRFLVLVELTLKASILSNGPRISLRAPASSPYRPP